MHWKKKLLRNCKLYVILDTQVNDYTRLFEVAKTAIKNGVGIIQLRDKYGVAEDILRFSEKVLRIKGDRTLYIINDRLDLAKISGADGVHLGQEDVPVNQARTFLGKNVFIGTSCQTFAHVLKAQRLGADYIGFGSVFKTQTKPDRKPMDHKLLEKVMKHCSVPVFAIGGMTLDRYRQIKHLGVERIAVCRAVCEARDVSRAVKNFNDVLIK